MIQAIVSDFGGVVTLPLDEAFKRAHQDLGVPLGDLGKAMQLLAERNHEPPLWTLERGQITEPEFMTALEEALGEIQRRAISLDGYGERLMGSLQTNDPLLARYRELRDMHGIRLAILTNNVREWQPRWTPLLPEGLFELIVDSGFEGVRKPEPEIYARTLSRLDLEATACAFIDDVEVNVAAARELGLHAIHFRNTEQTLAELATLVL